MSDRCVICLSHLPKGSIRYDSTQAAVGKMEFAHMVNIGIFPSDYDRSSDTNSMAQCPSCHYAYIIPKLITFSPSLPVLKYIRNYLNIPRANRNALHEVFTLLQLAKAGHTTPLPDPTSILPYLNLFTIVVLRPESLVGCRISTLHLPAISTLVNNQFLPAPDGTSADDENAVRIYDFLELVSRLDTRPASMSPGQIPLSPKYSDFGQRRYWRLALPLDAVLAALITQTTVGPGTYDSEEIRLVQSIYHTLNQEAFGARTQ